MINTRIRSSLLSCQPLLTPTYFAIILPPIMKANFIFASLDKQRESNSNLDEEEGLEGKRMKIESTFRCWQQGSSTSRL